MTLNTTVVTATTAAATVATVNRLATCHPGVRRTLRRTEHES
ncbi:hypothetical protein [Micromonospora haikouensis]